jgi:hypothetical protein
MNIEVPGIRPAIISDGLLSALDELLRFRHFRRHYFDLEYDWDRLELVEKKNLFAVKKTKQEFNEFTRFLEQVMAEPLE